MEMNNKKQKSKTPIHIHEEYPDYDCGIDEWIVIIDYYQCPKCGNKMYKGFENIKYCEKCGQEVKWK